MFELPRAHEVTNLPQKGRRVTQRLRVLRLLPLQCFRLCLHVGGNGCHHCEVFAALDRAARRRGSRLARAKALAWACAKALASARFSGCSRLARAKALAFAGAKALTFAHAAGGPRLAPAAGGSRLELALNGRAALSRGSRLARGSRLGFGFHSSRRAGFASRAASLWQLLHVSPFSSAMARWVAAVVFLRRFACRRVR